jgi:branched-chain amino acid transport system permease protein
VYALIALGYTMVYGILRLINFAHGDIYMLGAFIGLYASRFLHAGEQPTLGKALLVLVTSMVVCAFIGMLIERFAYKPVRRSPRLSALITAIGVSLLLEYSGQVFFGAAPRNFPSVFPFRRFELGGVIISSNQLIVIVVSVVLMVVLQLIVYRTKIGTAMRAVSLNPKAAVLMGVNNDVVISFTFGLGSALAAAGGILYALNYPSIDPLMGVMPGLKAFVASILGGIGNIPGAALGGLILGTVETFVSGSQWSTYKDAIAFAILIIILLFRPAGLLGRFTVEKV